MIAAALLLAGIFGTKSILWAQKTQEEKVQHITECMSKKLNLSVEQKAKVYVLNLKRSEGHQKAYEAGRKKEIIYAAVQEWEDGLKEILNNEQLKKIGIKS